MADDFNEYIREINRKELLNIEMAKNAAIRNYKEWAWHFELLKRNFSETSRLFSSIDNVATWDKDYTKTEEGLGWSSEGGYYFKAGLRRVDPSTRKANPSFSVQFGSDTSGIGDERILSGYSGKAENNLVGLDKIKDSSRLSEASTEYLLEKIDSCSLLIGISGLEENKETTFNLGIGFLYEHDLVEVCKQLFIGYYENRLDMDHLSGLIPVGLYQRRIVNDLAEDGNTILHTEDPKWRNE
jgi:hypothetical protein